MLITFEGIDGCGKSTQIALLVSYFKEQGKEVYLFREPGGNPLSEKIRNLLLDSKESVHPMTELLLFSAARAQLVFNNIRPLLERKKIVLLDRFYDSTIAYQGFGRKVSDIEHLRNINVLATGGLIPDITFYLNVPLAVAAERRQHLGEGDRMERSGEAFYERVLEGYEMLSKTEKRFFSIDASGTAQQTFDIIIQILKENERKGTG
ncbi:dTMP kinase [Balneolaceae bacterium ANBcel3]|nr:dTMP kinase [Balneolaceae bacterium ANBcel3]